MKKILVLTLCVLMVVPMLIVGCTNPETPGTTAATVKFGAGLYVGKPTASDATEDADGSGKIDITIAAVTVDADGKIVACQLDTASSTVKFKADGTAVESGEFKTKYEFGADYNMVTYGGAAKEWFEQADAFEGVVAGKTIDQVKALVADANKGTDEVMNAGCTIMVNEFVSAIEKAYAAATVEVSKDAALKINVSTSAKPTDVTEDADGKQELESYIFAAAVDADGKVLAASSDCVAVTFTFDENGASTLDTTKAVVSKKEQGANYGMVNYGGAAKEWFEQAAAFDAACVGKTAAEIAGLQAEDGHGSSDLQAAGCTIYVTGFVKAATKK